MISDPVHKKIHTIPNFTDDSLKTLFFTDLLLSILGANSLHLSQQVLNSRREVQIRMKAESVEVTVVAKPQSNKKIEKETPTKRQWLNLPQDILNLIISKLYFTDRIRFRAVCKDWHLPIGDRLVDELPWIVYRNLFIDINPCLLPVKRTKVMISDPVHKRTHEIPNFAGARGEYLKYFGNSRVCGSKCGWLLLGNYKSDIGIDVFLYCPFTNNLIRLPAISTITHYYYEATFSSSNPTSPDCVFIFVFTYYCLGQYLVGFSTYRNGDNEWRTKILDGGLKHSVKCLVCSEKGVCYFVLGCGKLGAFQVESQEWSWLVDSLWIPRDHMHLVESNGYLFLAACSFDYLKWKVFRYAENERGWIEQQSLGDKALFVSMYGSYLRPAVGDIDLADKIFCICYYINVSQIIVYSVKDGKRCENSGAFDWIANDSLEKALGSTWGVPVEPKAELKTVLDSRREVQITMKAESVEVTVVAKPQSNKTTDRVTATRRQWSNLPQDILNLIISKLYFTDRIRFRAVCKDWHLPIGDRLVDELPWMVNHTLFVDINPRFLPVKRTKVMISDPVHKRTHSIPNFAGTSGEYLKYFGNSRVCGSKCGWLLLGNYKSDIGIDVFLYCPFTNNLIRLPAISTITHYYYEATFSSSNPTSPDCVFVFVFTYYCLGQYIVGFSTYRNGDNEWRTKILDGGLKHSVKSLVCTEKGVCYFVLGCGKLGAFHVESQEWSWLVDSLWIPRDHMHLVESNGYLFLAACSFDYLKWKVFRYTENERGWIEQQSLGDKALFVSMYGSYLRPAVGDIDLADKIFCICYYINVSQIIVYSLKDGKRCENSRAYDWIVNDSLQKVWIEPPY
ncbi:hypothetical protein LguiB_013829 [Lonicera macranthoides]